MRTQVIPAQITTVEDRIAGNFSLSQIIILLSPVLFATLLYAFLPPQMVFAWYKLGLILIFVVLSVTLAIMVRGKIILNWLLILIRFNLRPKFYVFNKNATYAREVYKPEQEKTIKQKKTLIVTTKRIDSLSVKEILKLNNFLSSQDFSLTYRPSRKGGLNVALEKVSK